MTEQFRLAANVLLKRRLNNLLRIDKNVEIDLNYITCAEYQLFIDDKRKAGENRQPDHWTIDRFPPGDAKKPITGVRASDAEEFCEWLTQQDLELGFRYRLSTLTEAEEYPATEKQVGCWSKDGDKLVIAGIEVNQRRILQEYMVDALARNLDFDLSRAYEFALDLAPNLDLTSARASTRASARAYKLSLDLINTLDRASELDLSRDLDIALARTREHDLALDRTLIRALASDRELDLSLTHTRLREQGHDSDLVSVRIRSNLLLIYILWNFLSDVYDQTSREPRLLKSRSLTRQDCENLSREYADKRDEVFHLYAFFVLLDERRAGRMPAWESIRIVRFRDEIYMVP